MTAQAQLLNVFDHLLDLRLVCAFFHNHDHVRVSEWRTAGVSLVPFS
jgi:hypothetical protein